MTQSTKQNKKGSLLVLVSMAATTTKLDRKKIMEYAKADAKAWNRRIIFCPDMKGSKRLSFSHACDLLNLLAKSLEIENYETVITPLTDSLSAFAKQLGVAHILIEIPRQEKGLLGIFDFDFLWESYIWKLVKESDIDVTVIEKGAVFASYKELVVPIDSFYNLHKINGVITIAKRFGSKVYLFVESPTLDADKDIVNAALKNVIPKLEKYGVSYELVIAKNKNEFELNMLKYTIKKQRKRIIAEVPPGKIPMNFLKYMKSFFNGRNPDFAITLVKYEKKESFRI